MITIGLEITVLTEITLFLSGCSQPSQPLLAVLSATDGFRFPGSLGASLHHTILFDVSQFEQFARGGT